MFCGSYLKCLSSLYLQWFPLPVVIAYRLLFSLFCWFWIIYSIVKPATKTAKWLIYLTDWTFTCVALYFSWSAAVSTICYVYFLRQREAETSNQDSLAGTVDTAAEHHSQESQEALIGQRELANRQQDDFSLPDNSQSHFEYHSLRIQQAWYHKVLWVLYSIAVDNSPVVTVIYWTLLFTGGKLELPDITFHLLNSVLMVTETCLSAIPVRFFHVIYAWAYAAIYLIFTIVYWQCGGTDISGNKYIYPILDYDHGDPKEIVLIVVGYGLIGLPVAQFLIFGLFKLRSYVSGFQQGR